MQNTTGLSVNSSQSFGCPESKFSMIDLITKLKGIKKYMSQTEIISSSYTEVDVSLLSTNPTVEGLFFWWQKNWGQEIILGYISGRNSAVWPLSHINLPSCIFHYKLHRLGSSVRHGQ